MKKIFTILVPIAIGILLSASVFAQAPQKMSYQAVIRDASINLITSHAVGMRISILQGTTPVYVETQTTSTNANGLVSVEIGNGTFVSGVVFSAIDWSTGTYFIKTETDPAGGTNYTAIVGTSQLLSVPYALNAKTAESITGTITETDPIYTSSQAANITANDITKVSNLSGINTGDQDLTGLATTSAVTTGLATKVDKEAGKGLSTNDYTTAEQTKLAAITGDQDLSGLATTSAVTTSLNLKVDKVTGKGLSTNDYTTAEQTKLAAITGDQDLSGLATTSAVTTSLNLKVDKEAGKGLSTNDYTNADATKLAAITGTNTGDQDITGLATTTSVTTGLATKVDKEAGKGLSTNDYTNADATKLAAITGTNTGDQNLSGLATTTSVTTGLATKVDKVAGKGLSANDYTTVEQTKLAAITGTNTGDQDLSGLATTTSLATKVDKEAGKGLSTNDYTTAAQTKLTAITGTNTGDQDLSGLATTSAVNTALNLKVDKEAGKGLSTNDYTTVEQTKLAAITGTNTGDQNLSSLATTSAVTTSLNLKVDKEAGKGLSTNDYTTAAQTKLTAITGTNTGDQDLSGLATTSAVTTSLNLKVDKEAGKGLSTKDYTTAEQAKVSNLSGINTGDQDLTGLATTSAVTTGLATKVDKEAGKGLSTNDYTTAEQAKVSNLSGINTGDQDLSGLATTSAVTTSLNLKVDKEAGKGLSTNDYTTAAQTKLAAITGTNTGDNATNTQYSGLDAAKANLSGATFTGAISATNLSGSNTGDQTLPTLVSLGAVASNTAITAGTNTKITYDAKGLVTAGAAATTADIAASTNKNYVTDAQQTVISNTSGTNSGDNATNTQYSGLDAAKANLSGATFTGAISATNLSGSNTGDQTLPTLVSLGAVAGNAAIIAGTNTKITYDAKGLVTAGTAATTADIAASTDKNYVIDAKLAVLNNTSGTNTGDQTLPTLSSLGAVAGNAAIIAGTNTKITYDSKGLVTAGVAATTADIAASTNKNYVTDAQQTVITNTSGTNTGDNATNTQYSGLVTNATHTDDVTGSGALTIANNAVTDAKFRQGSARSIVGVTGNATANTADIQGVTDQILRVNGAGDALAFGSIDLSKIAAIGTSILPVANGGMGADVTPAGAGEVLYSSSTTAYGHLGAGTSGQVLTSAGAGAPTWQSTGATAWSLLGNTETIDGNNFIGTINDVPFNVKVHNQRAGRIDEALFNTFWGFQAGNLTTGTGNTANGQQALFSNTDGTKNTANGLQALYSNTSGGGNTANGAAALYSNTTGASNTANGYQALYSNTSGGGNTANGAAALYSNTTGASNTANGVSALLSNTSGGGNTAIGESALYSNTNGNFNTAIGYGATVDESAGSINNATAIGNGAIVTASNRVQIGNSAVTDVYFGNGTTTVLHGSFGTSWSLTGNAGTVDGTNFIGTTDDRPFNVRVNSQKAGRIDNMSGLTYNTFWGYEAGESTTGISNTAMGFQALISNVGGAHNTAIGRSTLSQNISGTYNTAIGESALGTNGNGNNNTAVGYEALIVNTSGSGNTAIGETALYTNSTGTNNTALGFNANVSSTALTNSTAIGYGAVVNASNRVQIGNSSVTDVFFGDEATTVLHGVAVREVADEFTATGSQISFTLTQTPSANSKVKMYINGVRISNTAYGLSGATLTYDPTFNGAYALLITDRVQFDYFY